MRIENKRIISRKNIDRIVIEDKKAGIFLIANNLEIIKKLEFSDYGLLDYSYNGEILLLNSKDWLIRRNANKTWLMAIDLNTNEVLFKTDKFLAYRSIIDSTSTKFLLEYYNGLCSMDLKTGEILYRKDKVSKSLYNADLHHESNKIFIPTEKKSISVFNFETDQLEEIKLEKTSATTWIKFDNSQTNVLISDKKNSLHCFEYNSFQKPIWTIDFSKYQTDSRIWPSEILTTNANLGCIHATRPCPNQVGFCSGSLYIFDITVGKVLEKFEYSHIDLKRITDFNFDQIFLDDFSTFSLTKKTISKTHLSALFDSER